MAADNKLELVVEVDVAKGNASIKSLNTGLSSIEQAASKAGRGASTGIDSITVSMAKGAVAGNLLADAIKGALSTAKAWIVGSIQMAAHESRLEASMRALAKSHGIAQGAAMAQMEAVRRIGFHGEEAIHTISRLIIADIDLSKATGLAKIAKDAAAIENVSAAEALEKIVLAIESGKARGLRSMGMFLNLEKEVTREELKLNRTLNEGERQMVAYNAVMREGAKIAGAHAAASVEAETMMKGLDRAVVELREAFGAQFQAEYKNLLGALKDLASWAKDNVGSLGAVAEAIKNIGIVIVAYKLPSLIMGVVHALNAFRLAAIGAAAANPFGLIAAGVVSFGLILWNEKKKLDQMNDSLGEMIKRRRILDAIQKGLNVEQLKAIGITEDDVRTAMRGKEPLAGEVPWGADAGLRKGLPEPDEDALKLAREIRRKQMEAVRSSAEGALQAEQASIKGPAKALLDFQKDVLKYSTFVDERGVLRKFTLLAQTRANLERELSAKVRAMQKEEMAAYLKEQQEAIQQRLDWESGLYQKRLQYEVDVATQALEHGTEVYAFEEQRAGFDRDARLRVVEATDAQTLRQKLVVEQRKMGIEVDYLERVHEIKLRLFDIETSRLVQEEQQRLANLGYQAERINLRIGELTEQREEIRRQTSEQTDAAITAAQENAAIRQTQLVRDHNRQVFDAFKRQAEGVFDALLTKSHSIWAAIGDSFKTAMLTAIKEVVTSRVAAMLTLLITGQRVSVQGAVPGPLGTIGGLLAWLGVRGSSGVQRGGTAAALADMPMPESDPVRVALLRNLEKRTREQAEFERIVAADSQGLVDVGTGLAALVATLHPVGNFAVKGLSVLGDPSWKQIQSVLQSFSPTEGGSAPSTLAAFPLFRLKGVPRGGAITAPKFATVPEAEAWMKSALGVKRASLGTDLGLAQQVVEGFTDTMNRGGVIPPRIAIDAAGFPIKNTLAHYRSKEKQIEINPLSPHWGTDTAFNQSERFLDRWSSTPNPNSTFFHETGHYLHDVNIRNADNSVMEYVRKYDDWPISTWRDTAQTVSAYAGKSPKEFVAEVYAGHLDGRKYSREVEELYRQFGGPEVRMPRPAPPEWSMPTGTLRRPDRGPGNQVPLPDMNPAGDWTSAGAANAADPIRMALLQNLEKRTRAQAEFDRILAADSQGMVDAGASFAAFAANMTPVGNLGIKALSVLGDPSWKHIQSVLESFGPTEGGSGGPSLAGGPVAALIPRGAPVHEQVNLLFNKTQSQMAAVGRKGGLARVRNLLQKQWEKEIAASAKQEAIEYSTSVYKGPQVSSTETTRQAMDKLDALFPWLAGAEKTTTATEAAARAAWKKRKESPLEDVNPWWWEGAPGGTGGGAGQAAMNASTARGGAPLGNLGALGSNSLAGIKAFLGIGGSVQTGPGMATTWQAATMGQKASAMGRSDAALMGGAALALYGLQRGGKTGLAMTTGGGALIGFKFGGPIGAGVGAWIGFWAGVARLFVKGAQEKAREKIKATYGVDISDNGVLKQIVEMAKQGFGGNLDMAIRSQPVRELIDLYAMSTGQPTKGMPATMRPVSLVQSGGSLYQSPGYSNGIPVPAFGGLPTFDRIGAGAPQNAGPIVVNITVPGAKEFFEKETVRVVIENPRAVQSAAMTATRSNAGRREMTSLQMSPGLLTA